MPRTTRLAAHRGDSVAADHSGRTTATIAPGRAPLRLAGPPRRQAALFDVGHCHCNASMRLSGFGAGGPEHRAGGGHRRVRADEGVPVPVEMLGLPDQFIPQGTRSQLLTRYGLDPAGIAAAVIGSLPDLGHAPRYRQPAGPVLGGDDQQREYR